MVVECQLASLLWSPTRTPICGDSMWPCGFLTWLICSKRIKIKMCKYLPFLNHKSTWIQMGRAKIPTFWQKEFQRISFIISSSHSSHIETWKSRWGKPYSSSYMMQNQFIYLIIFPFIQVFWPSERGKTYPTKLFGFDFGFGFVFLCWIWNPGLHIW